jgi:hypothetical protein
MFLIPRTVSYNFIKILIRDNRRKKRTIIKKNPTIGYFILVQCITFKRIISNFEKPVAPYKSFSLYGLNFGTWFNQ